MLKSFALRSGSSGNCFCIDNYGDVYLIDIGLSYKKTTEILSESGIDILDVKGLFITHAHSDHVLGLEVFIKNNKNSKIYITEKTCQKLKLKENENIIFVREDEIIKLSDMTVLVVKKEHDCVEPVSFVFENGRKVGFFTDLGSVNNQIKNILSNLDVIYFEANYDNEIMKNNPNLFYPYIQRLLSGVSHLSVDQCCDILCEIGRSSQRIVLSHISENTNSYENTYRKVMARLEGIENSPEIIMSFQDEETDWI